MKADLNLALIKRLKISERPVGLDAKGALVFEANVGNKPYILWDSNRDAPPGFGVRVAGKKTYIVRRKVNGVSIMPTVGNVSDFLDLGLARKKAAELARAMVETGKNPNQSRREASALEPTLGDVLASYRNHLETRVKRRASPETLRAVDRAVNKFKEWNWAPRKLKELRTDEIIERFQSGAATPTAMEQTFRLASTATKWAIGKEMLDATHEGRAPALTVNPFTILTLHGMYRTRAQIAHEREERGVRNPLSPSETLGPFLEAAWSKRIENDNRTGVDFLIVMLLLGCRKSEHSKCKWAELLSADELKTTSHVWLGENGEYGPHVFLHKTKNGRNHRLPLGRMTTELLRRRQEAAAEETLRRGFGAKSRAYVFPARSKFSKSGHYSDATALLASLREESQIAKLAPHDLRRSFGAVMTSLDVPETVKKRFLNHADASVTDTYTKPEWLMLREWMERIEQTVLSKAPNIYNALKPVDWPPLFAPDPHICKPAKPRSGRPRKQANVSEEKMALPDAVR
ncbi:tyrosine-type recombinase/integrase [Burkholderia thailandensis]|uniref:tyrosine-type recombinase/integrase n=1 Tax=Burkholderia thailandensis TaxID=57975 RepID=UPI00217F0AA7|nr:tyrosine-type recombinase/integrase [Burkholderia thailandensis]MCS6471785.1 tyrosine-type recombinase/integrase [Burkholderia thailandensis]